MIPDQDIDAVFYGQFVELLHEVDGIAIVWLVFSGCSDKHVERPGLLIGGYIVCGAVGSYVGSVVAPDAALGDEVASQRDDRAEDIGMVQRDNHCAEGAHRVGPAGSKSRCGHGWV